MNKIRFGIAKTETPEKNCAAIYIIGHIFQKASRKKEKGPVSEAFFCIKSKKRISTFP
ncbi:MAG: hypothetical protein K5838_04025 [Elusimicrobiales bacterium]|nr:hypothetical protein [Elusimicrobiales bacterium]